MANEAKIDIKVNDSQVDSLVQSLNRLSNSLNETQREFNQTQREARQTGTAIQNAGRQSQSGGRGIQQMGTKLAGATRAIAAGGAALGAFAAAAGATVVAVKTLEVGIEQSREAFRAYISTAEETKEQFEDLTENASQLQLQLGKTILELIGGEEAFGILNDAIETGVQFLENFREAITSSASGLSVADVGARLLRESLALLFRVLAEGQRILETTVNALNLLSNFNFSNFISQQREIRDTFREQRDLIRDLRNGTVDLSQRSARDPIRIAVEGAAGGGAGGISEGDRQIISAIEALQTQEDAANEVIVGELKRALLAAQGNLPTEMGKAATQVMDDFFTSGAAARGATDPLVRSGLDYENLIKQQRVLEDLLNRQREIEIDQTEGRREIEESLERQIGLQAALAEAARQGAAASTLEAQAQNRLAEADRLLRGRPTPGAGAARGAVQGVGLAAGVGAGAATGGLLGRLGQNLANPALRGNVGGYLRAVGRNLPTMLRGVGTQGALAPLRATGALVGGGALAGAGTIAGAGALLGASVYDRRRRAQGGLALVQTADAMQLMQEADELERMAASLRASSASELERERMNNALLAATLHVDLAEIQLDAMANADQVEAASQRISDFRASEEKVALEEIAQRQQMEANYFNFVQESIRGTKEEAARFIDFIEGSSTEEAFRNLTGLGADPRSATGLAISAAQGGPFTTIPDVGFSLARDLDNLEGFRSIAADDTFPSVQLLLEAINGELTEQERAWARINGGIMEYMKAIEDSKKATRNAFKTDAISGFQGAIIQISETIGTTIADGFDDGLKGGERVKKLLGNLLGDFLKTIGATAIAQGAIVSFGDPLAGGLPNPARGLGLIAAGTAAVAVGTALSRSADRIGGGGGAAASSSAGAATLSPGGARGGGSNEQTTNIFVENRFGNRFDARELDRAAADSFARAAQAGQA